MDVRCIFLVLLFDLTFTEDFFSSAQLTGYESIVSSVTRQNDGDSFQTEGRPCNPDVCIGLSSGTAAVASAANDPFCTCQCHRHLPAFREDVQICVDDINECPLAPFAGSSTSQQMIPFVFLPLKGQIVHPNKDIHFPGIVTPICAISGAKFLTSNGWADLRNPSDGDVPFRLFRDEGRTFLQWEGEPVLRNKIGGRLVLVNLMCRELDSKREEIFEGEVFSRCVAFRVAGRPLKYANNVSEVVFAPDAHSSGSSTDGGAGGLSVTEIVAIGVCSVLLGLIYVASVFLYLHIRRRRKEDAEEAAARGDGGVAALASAEEGVVKSNPLLGLGAAGRLFVPVDAVAAAAYSDTTESDTDATPTEPLAAPNDDRKKNLQVTSALVHSYRHELANPYSSSLLETYHQDSATIERLPEENVSIVETLEGREDHPENVKAIGTTRKKLYFNPAYFEPHLLQTPPPAAIEFLTKIREVISIAKQKMSAKRFVPNLLGIPEEDRCYSIETSDCVISLKRENSRRGMCSPKDFRKLPMVSVTCESCSESKQKSIRKWLEDIPMSLNEEVSKSLILEGSPKEIRTPKTRSLCSENSNSDKKPKKKVIKPKAPPPPLPRYALQENQYESIEKKSNPLNLPPPDMIHEALTVEEETRIPTITKKKMNAVINEFVNNSKNLIDYETDSLERSSKNKGFSTPTEYGDASPSSHPSPSLSAALPMDEEMTMQNAIINKKTGAMTISKLNMGLLKPEDDYELIILKKGGDYNLPELLQRGNLVSEVYVNNGYNYGSAESESSVSNSSTLQRESKIRYRNEEPGRLLIEVEDCPDNYIKVEDSDEFEADTLDRKSNKLSISDDYVDSLERPKGFQLRSNGSFNNNYNFNRTFGSLREIYEAKTKKIAAADVLYGNETEDYYEGKLLTLEERHSRRQRKLIDPPDLIPPKNNEISPIYEHPKPPRKVIKQNSIKPPLPPKKLIKKSQIESNYESPKKPDSTIFQNLMQTDDLLIDNRQFILHANVVPNLDIFSVPLNWKFKNSSLRKYLGKPEDSGYLSNDSDETKNRKCENVDGSETDESFGDGQSESGAESVETHSVFFDSFRNPGSLDSGMESDVKLGLVTDDCASSDSENTSFKTVVNGKKS